MKEVKLARLKFPPAINASHSLQASAKLMATRGFRDWVGHREQKIKFIDRVRMGDWHSLTSLAMTNLDPLVSGLVSDRC